MIAGCSVARSTESFASQDIGCSVLWGTEGFGGAFMIGFAYCHPSPLWALPHSCKWGNAVPMSISLWPAWALPWHGGLLQLREDLLF